ncbi:hypothetical protein GGH94_001768 [Coemansia aciculifera]|uniref:BZIP domain-containing protein n=1 Tax=Coemansia aciculifera TaxID=417176 RepID=A0A9W8IL10_9FUNG|nr:hypothetical protein GGH94_001768 [Coemansia aciculifera]
MEYPADYDSPSQQPGLAASIPDIKSYTSPPPLHPPSASAELLFSQHAFADGQHSTISSEPDYAQDDGSQIPDDANARRRSINSSKRAAQNRAAQRAFRLRRERYVTSLEEKARNYDRLESAYIDLQRENHQLRAHLQKTLSENAALRAHLATSAPVSPSLSGSLATPFSPGVPATTPISGALAQQPLPHQPQLAESSLFHRQTPQQQSHAQLQRPHHHQSHSHSLSHSHSHQLSQEQLRHTGRRSAGSENSPYGFGYTQAARHSPSHTSTSPTTTTNYHSSMPHARPPPQSQQSTGAPASSLLHRRPQSPGGAQYQQRPAAMPCQLRREHSLQHLESNSPPLSSTTSGMPHAAVSPIQTFGYTRRFETLHTGTASVAFASPVECMSSPGSAWENNAGMETSPTATGALPQYRPPIGSESASSCSSATAAQMLPSVREITMSIGALLPTSPHSDHGPSAHQQFSQESSSNQMDDTADSKRRPW